MEDRLQQLERKVELLTARMERIESRLALGPTTDWPPRPALEASEPDLSAEFAPTRAAFARWIPLLGRTLLVLGGAFLIRALSDGGALRLEVGIALGLALATASIGLAHQASARGRRTSAQFHGVAGALIGYPLALETATRMGALPAWAATVIVGALTALLFVLALRDHLASLAWVGTIGCLGSVMVLTKATDALQELTVVTLLLAVSALWLSEVRHWKALPWLPVFAMDLLVLRDLFTAIRARGPDRGPLILSLVFCSTVTALSLVWLGYRSWLRAAALGTFEVAQTVIGVVIGLIALAQLGPRFGWGTAAVGVVAFALATASMAVALAIVPRGHSGSDFLFYSAAAVALQFAGAAFLIPTSLRGVLWAALAWGAAVLVRRFPRPALWAYAVILGCAAAVASGLVEMFAQALIAGGEQAPRAPSVGSVVVFAVLLGVYQGVASSPVRLTRRGWFERGVATGLALLVALCTVAWVVQGERALLGGRSSDRAFLASARMVGLMVVANFFAWARRRLPLPELGWTAYVLLVLSGIKLLAEDIPYGRAATLVVAFALYGLSLIVVPRLTRQGPALDEAPTLQTAAAAPAKH